MMLSRRVLLAGLALVVLAATVAVVRKASGDRTPVVVAPAPSWIELLQSDVTTAAAHEQRAPMGQTVIGGIITSSILTLVVVPVIYTYLDDLGAWLRRRWPAEPARAPEAGDAVEGVGAE